MKGAFGGRRGIFHTGITGMGGTGGIMGTIGTAYGIMGICIGVLWARESDCRLEEVDTTEAGL